MPKKAGRKQGTSKGVRFRVVDTVYEVEGLGEALTAAGVSQSDFAREAGVAAAYAWRTASGANTRVRGRNAEKYMDALERLGILVSEEG